MTSDNEPHLLKELEAAEERILELQNKLSNLEVAYKALQDQMRALRVLARELDQQRRRA